MKLEKLSNEEIVFIYLLVEQMRKSFTDILNEGGLKYVVDSPLGEVEIFKEFTKEEVEELNSSLKLKLLCKITDKFKPVFDLIEESNEAAVIKVRDTLFPVEEDDSEEDM